MMRTMRLMWFMLGSIPAFAQSATLDIGVNMYKNSIKIMDASGTEVAEMAEGVQYFPNVSLTSDPVYLFGGVLGVIR
ncbi:hypothetical protein BA953_20660 [Vibrio coralliilyticus]|uniref:hypothetical protein n=1 Tax=Vibrio coralliilyticus TaxID=190893 RepID=UPI00081074FE|nr:hypothetical protein [Vibrio coralliilyticus]ANW26568.1 hypothetical protein BA953_20660 [Vibrio coralliilyticus]